MRSLLQTCPCRHRGGGGSSSSRDSGVSAEASEPAASASAAERAAAAGQSHKQRGNEHFKRKEYARAAAAYGDAIRSCPTEATCWLNRSIAYRQLEEWDQAASDAAKALELQPGSEKASYGRALALQKLGKVTEALQACEAGLVAHPEHSALLELQTALRAKAKQAAAGPKKYDTDYSKWADLEDSDDDQPHRGNQDDEYRPGPNDEAWKGDNPTQEERLAMVEDMLEACAELMNKEGCPEEPEPPKAVALPSDYMGSVGVLTLDQLAKYSCSNDRMLVSVYGDIYDVSSRPDIYGYGPKSFQAGKDITWSVIIGKETPKQCNRFYDIFKLDEDHRTRYLQIVCQRLLTLKEMCGDPVGRLENYVRERSLPPPPKDEIEECKQQ